MKTDNREQMNIVVVGHVDHGKSTVIGRLLADTGSLPQGKLEQVRATCERNARPFEYAFLLDALKEEQAQGITIDTARCFFKTARRDYIIIDAPGHVEFLKNMVSGAARAEAALLVIDAHEGVRENSKRHGYLVSMLGIRQLVVLVNKMDLVGYTREAFETVCTEYGAFLSGLGVVPAAFIPLGARDGENLARPSGRMPWYGGKTVLEHVDAFVKADDGLHKPLRMPVQDVYKFTAEGDDRRIIAGTIETGSLATGDGVVFLPSGKTSVIASVESFNTPRRSSAMVGEAVGVTLEDELYLPRGEIMCRAGAGLPHVGTRIRANIFWMGRAPMVCDRRYKIKISSARVPVRLVEVISSIDATDLGSTPGKRQIDRHDVAECVLETTHPVAFDTIDEIQATGRFVIVDNYDIAGGGIITAAVMDGASPVQDHVRTRELRWDGGLVSTADRSDRFRHQAKFIVITGRRSIPVAKLLEQRLFGAGYVAYYLGPASLEQGLDANPDQRERDDQVRHLGEVARILTGAGMLFITALEQPETYDLELLARLCAPHEFMEVAVDGEETAGSPGRMVIQGDLSDVAVVGVITTTLSRREIIGDFVI